MKCEECNGTGQVLLFNLFNDCTACQRDGHFWVDYYDRQSDRLEFWPPQKNGFQNPGAGILLAVLADDEIEMTSSTGTMKVPAPNTPGFRRWLEDAVDVKQAYLAYGGTEQGYRTQLIAAAVHGVHCCLVLPKP